MPRWNEPVQRMRYHPYMLICSCCKEMSPGECEKTGCKNFKFVLAALAKATSTVSFKVVPFQTRETDRALDGLPGLFKQLEL